MDRSACLIDNHPPPLLMGTPCRGDDMGGLWVVLLLLQP